MKLLVTGATGFIGRALITRILTYSDHNIYAAVRKVSKDLQPAVHQIKFDGISKNTDWNNMLTDVDGVIHAAARVHVMSDTTIS